MKNVLLQAAMKLNKNRKQKQWWQRAVRVMTTVVVFCTTYALILPAITMEGEPICGFEDHVHSEQCYVQQPVYEFACDLDSQVKVVHSHDTFCYDDQGKLICLLPEIGEHTHGEACYIQTQGEAPICEYVHTHDETCATKEQVLICGQEETEAHAHDASCGTMEMVLVCNTEEHEGHAHADECYETQVTTCELSESDGHTHDETCATTEKVLICTTEEGEGHVHGETCHEAQEVPCELVEGEGHIHSEACYEEQDVTCELTTNDDHVHDETCYEQQQALTCVIDEVVLHTHEASCFDAAGAVICGLEQVVAHQHTENCLVETEQVVETLTCELPEHTHEDTCYPLEDSEDENSEYLCGMGVHAHVESCYDAEGNLTCTIPEHAHEAACIVEDLDLTADVESHQLWEEPLNQLTLTGNWPKDVLTVAESQLGYQESVKNVILENGELYGYSRYGAWYGLPYGDWCAMFASFCLNYAGVEEYPLECNVPRWIEALTEEELYLTSDVYTAKPGDLIFFDYDQKKDMVEEIPVVADHVGIVVEHIPATETEPAKIKTIEGNTQDKVAYVTYELDDPAIIGYGRMPAGDLIILEYQGADYAVTVSFGQDANIPETAQLAVREIQQGTDEYNSYYQQSVAALIGQDAAVSEEELDVSFARFFDISFLVDGVAVEPAAAVDIQIRYAESFAVEEGDTGLVVHFAEGGAEVLDADTNQSESAEADTFAFSQGSFSVSGTLVTANTRAASNVATKVDFDTLDGTGNTEYVIYTQYNGSYYAIAAPASGKTGTLVEIQVADDGTVTWTGDANVRWTFVSTGNGTYDVTNENGRYLHAFYNGNGSDIGVIGTNSKGTALTSRGTGADETFTVKHPSSNVYVGISNGVFQATTNANNARQFYIAAAQPSVYHVWFDGTNGGMMSYYGSADTYLAVDPADNTITLPTTWQSSTKYAYTLNGWYDIKSSTYYKPGAEVTIDRHTVFYADWIAATYDVGQNNANVVQSVDTSDFITTYVFDYNVLFNAQSLTHTGTISAANHSEIWTIVNNGTVPYNNAESLGFAFIDYDSDGEFSYPLGRDNSAGDDINTNHSQITSGILDDFFLDGSDLLHGNQLLDLLFTPKNATPDSEDFVIGRNYIGTGNYLFQYMDSTTANYDGVHDGYYYLDARLNAASYNRTDNRFYLYNYLERTSDSRKDGGEGEYSDFLPFNSPYLFEADRMETYSERQMPVGYIGYEYDAKDAFTQDGVVYSEYGDAGTNYFFGIRTDIEFFLPNDAGTTDEYGNYGNISTRGEHMIFDFHGDDDVWVFVDGELLLDIGGLHGVMFGQIDFSTGKITVGKDGGETEVLDFEMSEGTHTMTVYYMERGSSQSNCAIYFNIAPRYDLEIKKEDIVSPEDLLVGAEFTIYTCEACANGNCTEHATPQLAQLWDSEEAHDLDMEDGNIDNAKSTFPIVDGVAKCWGISAGKTYYIKETKPPTGYPESDDLIRITLNNRGTATIETTTLHGSNGIATEGFAVIEQDVNNTLKIVALTVTNQKDGDTTEVRVEKTWAPGSDNLPQSITVYLTADGESVGRRATLTESNGWSYTWTGLPKYADEGIDQEIIYEVQEVLVPGFITTQGETQKVVDYVDWIRVDQMSDSKTFLLVHNGQALTYDGTSFGWMDPSTAELDTSLSAQWTVTTDHDGFHLKNGLKYTLTYGDKDNNGTYEFYGINNDAVALNQVFYYLNSRLVVHDHDVYYQFGSNGSVVSEDGLAFTLYQKEVLTGFLTNIINEPVKEEDQTFVEVTKVWDDGNDMHTGDSVTIMLYADGRDTGRTVILNAANNWSGGFYDLPYYQEDGVTPVEYTVVEESVQDYLPTYSDPVVLTGLPVELWREASTLTNGEIYRFTNGSSVLAESADGDLISALSDLDDTYQQWRAVAYNRSIILQNVGSGNYLSVNNNALAVVRNNYNAVSATIDSDGYVKLNQLYLEVKASHVGVTSNAGNISNQNVTQLTTVYGRDGTGYTITNRPTTYRLPQTGGVGTSPYTFGGLLMMAAALMYISKFRRKRQKGGKYHRS